MRINIFCENLDIKQYSFIDTLFFKDSRIHETKTLDEAMFVAILSDEINKIVKIHKDKNIKYFIILDLRDSGQDTINIPRALLKFIKKHNLIILYLKLQIYIQDYYNFLKSDPNIIILSLPLLLGGAARHIMDKDEDESYLFVNNLVRNDKNYKFDYSFIGAITSLDRLIVIDILSGFKKYKSFIKITYPGIKAFKLPEEDVAFPSSRIIKTRRIPLDKMIKISRASKINLSLNGSGMWSLRDGELFSRNCFNLRQYHVNLNINPLTPKDGIHWAVFTNKDLLNKIEYYLKNDEERELINDRGYEYFKNGLTKEWAKYYVDRLICYFKIGNKKAFEDLLVYNKNLTCDIFYRVSRRLKGMKELGRNIEGKLGILLKRYTPRLYALLKKMKKSTKQKWTKQNLRYL